MFRSRNCWLAKGAFGGGGHAARGHPDFRASGILSDGALGRRCYLLIPGDLNNALQLGFQTPSRPRRTAIIFRQLGSADYDLGRRPAPSREESVSLLAIPEWRLHLHIFQESAAALPVQNLNRHDGRTH